MAGVKLAASNVNDDAEKKEVQMVRGLICLIFGCTLSVVGWSQKDTFYFYLDSSRFKCSRDNGIYLVKQYKQKGKWIQENRPVATEL